MAGREAPHLLAVFFVAKQGECDIDVCVMLVCPLGDVTLLRGRYLRFQSRLCFERQFTV
jgi:hypothetical protein